VLGLIGPNGAGKTTLIDAVTGFVRAKAGTVRIDDEVITSWSPRRRAQRGLSRSFQSLELFEDMTVLENLLTASEAGTGRVSYVKDFVAPGKPVLTGSVAAAIDTFSLERELDQRPTDLPYGRRRLVAIARAIAANPSFLLLDEPATGLSEQERTELVTVVRTLAEQQGMGVLVVEHDVEVVTKACDNVVVLDFGREIARGTPQEIRHNQSVIDAYLGEPRREQRVAGLAGAEGAVSETLTQPVTGSS
jgi:sulfate-transporting ATPase